MKEIAEDRPQELRLRMRVRAQLGEFLSRILEREDFRHRGIDDARGFAVGARLRVQHLDVLADLAEEAGAGFLAQGALRDQPGKHRRRTEEADATGRPAACRASS